MLTAEEIKATFAMDPVGAEDLEPDEDRVLVRRVTYAKSRGGIELPDTGKTLFAKVLAVGPGKLRDDGTRTKMRTEVGQIILLPYGVQEISLESKDVVIVLREVDILCHVKPKNSKNLSLASKCGVPTPAGGAGMCGV